MTYIHSTQPTSLVGRFFGIFSSPKANPTPVELVAKSALATIGTEQQSLLPFFWDNSFRPMARDFQKENIGLPAATLVLATLESQFGLLLVQKVANRYGLNNKAAFDLNDLRAMLVGISVHVKPEHLKARLDDLRKLEAEWQHAGAFETLNKAQMNDLVALFRTNLTLAVLNKITVTGDSEKVAAFNADLKNLKKFEQAGTFRYDADQEVAINEYLGHGIIYSNLEVGSIVPIKTGPNAISYLKITKTIYGDGFTSFIFASLENPLPGKPMNVYIAHRGTHFGDIRCIRRLTEPHSAGHYSYSNYESEVIKGLKEAIPCHVTDVRILNSGHSLGGADSSRTTDAIARSLAVLKQSSKMNPAALANHPLLKVREVKTVLFNGAGIGYSTNDSFQKAERAINGHDLTTRVDDEDDFEIVEKPVAVEDPSKVKFTLRHVIVAGDFVQRCGERKLNAASPYVDVQIIKYDHGHEGWLPIITNLGLNGLKAHTSQNTNKPALIPTVRASQAEVEKNSTTPLPLWGAGMAKME